jgi:hypothetical protein
VREFIHRRSLIFSTGQLALHRQAQPHRRRIIALDASVEIRKTCAAEGFYYNQEPINSGMKYLHRFSQHFE